MVQLARKLGVSLFARHLEDIFAIPPDRDEKEYSQQFKVFADFMSESILPSASVIPPETSTEAKNQKRNQKKNEKTQNKRLSGTNEKEPKITTTDDMKEKHELGVEKKKGKTPQQRRRRRAATATTRRRSQRPRKRRIGRRRTERRGVEY